MSGIEQNGDGFSGSGAEAVERMGDPKKEMAGALDQLEGLINNLITIIDKLKAGQGLGAAHLAEVISRAEAEKFTVLSKAHGALGGLSTTQEGEDV